MNTKRAAAACKRSTAPFSYNTYGEPMIRGVRIEIIVSRFRGGESIMSLADDYKIKSGEVEEAIRCGAR